HIKLEDDSYFENNFYTIIDIASSNIVHWWPTVSKDILPDVMLINRGEITITERIMLIDKSAIPTDRFRKTRKHFYGGLAKDKNKNKSLSTFEVVNEARMHIATNLYIMVNDVEAFKKDVGLLTGLKFESPMIVKSNTGSCKKTVEFITEPGERDATLFDMLFEAKKIETNFPMTKTEEMIKHNLGFKKVQMRFKNALSSIQP
ncbi:hypothetical protein PENTCL1PPCAC_677, partial [Pristionchus entomophagus]